MKSEINLLPPAAAKMRIKRLYTKRVARMYLAIMLGMALVLASYGAVYGVLAFELKELEDGDVLSADVEIQEQVSETNLLLRTVHEEAGTQVKWLPLVAEALQLAPSDIEVTAIELNRITIPSVDGIAPPTVRRSLSLQGASESRTAVVEYERALQALPWVGNVEAPLQNLANGGSITFSFTLFPSEEEQS